MPTLLANQRPWYWSTATDPELVWREARIVGTSGSGVRSTDRASRALT
jgi:hypothetical protein